MHGKMYITVLAAKAFQSSLCGLFPNIQLGIGHILDDLPWLPFEHRQIEFWISQIRIAKSNQVSGMTFSLKQQHILW
jgi:hypothetical protein